MGAGEGVGRRGIDAELVRALAAGRIGEAAARRRAQADPGPIVSALVDAELATRRGESTVAGLVELAARVASEADTGDAATGAAGATGAPGADPAVLRWWAGALVAERCGLEVDLAGARRATAVLGGVPDDPLVPVAVLWIRGRLRRVAGLVELFGAHPDRAGFRRLRSQAIADFTRADLPEEVAVTRVLGATAEVLWLWEDVERNVAAAVDARAMVGPDSVWAPFLDAVLAVLAIGAGDRALADRALGDRERGPRAGRPPSSLGAAGPVLRALAELGDSGESAPGSASASATEALAAAALRLRRTDPLGGYRLRLVAASALLDVGQGAVARDLALPVLDMPPMDHVDELEREVLALRLGLHGGEAIPVADLAAVLDRFAEVGHAVRAAGLVGHLASDLVRIGRDDDASALRGTWPREPVQAAGRATEAGPATASGARDEGQARVRVRVMAPVVTVEVEGQRRELRATAVRLLLALLVAHPAPLAAETAADALWPAAAWDSDRRQRLNTVVHRLRQGLGGAGGAVGRVGDVLTLAAGEWDVDLFRLRRALARAPGGDGPTVAEALAGVSGNLGNAQFPYDEQLVEERRMLVAAIAYRLDAGDATGSVDPEALRSLGMPPPLSTS